MTAPDYLPEPETRAELAQARRAAARARTAGAVYQALRVNQGPTPAFYDAAAVLAFERANPAQGGHREDRIRRTFGVNAARYQQRVFHLIHDDEALARSIDAQTVNRLLRLEAELTEARRRRTEGITR